MLARDSSYLVSLGILCHDQPCSIGIIACSVLRLLVRRIYVRKAFYHRALATRSISKLRRNMAVELNLSHAFLPNQSFHVDLANFTSLPPATNLSASAISNLSEVGREKKKLPASLHQLPLVSEIQFNEQHS